jgi:hypothetical protein
VKLWGVASQKHLSLRLYHSWDLKLAARYNLDTSLCLLSLSLSLSTQLSRPLISGSTFGRKASWPEEERNKGYSVEEEAGVQQDHHPQ